MMSDADFKVDENVTQWFKGCLLVSVDVNDINEHVQAVLFTAARVACAEKRPALVVNLRCPDDKSLTVSRAENAMSLAYIAANEGLAAARCAAAAAGEPAITTDVVVLPPVLKAQREDPAKYVPAGVVVDVTTGESACKTYVSEHAQFRPDADALDCIAKRVSAVSSTKSQACDDCVVDSMVEQSCIGGTFDRLHAGHRHMLALCVLLTSRIMYIGVTDPSMLKSKKHTEMIQSYEARRLQLMRTLWLMNPTMNYRFEALVDPAGPAQKIPEIQAIVVSGETVRGAEFINSRRTEQQMSPLRIFVVGFIPPPSDIAADALGKLSSSSLRNQEHQASSSSS